MPTIDLGDWENGLSYYACFSLWALMLHPNNEKHRKEFIAKFAFNCKLDFKENIAPELEANIKKLVNSRKLRKKDIETEEFKNMINEYFFNEDVSNEIYFDEIIDRVGGERTISDSPSFEDVIERSHRNSSKPVLAGELLFVIMQLVKNLPGKGSVNRACKLIAYQRGISKTTIMKAWEKFKPVSHLWAAFKVSVLKSENGEDFMQGLDPFDPENLPKFLGVAEYFRKFGESNFPKNSRTSTLDKKEMWAPVNGFPLEDWGYEPPEFTEKENGIVNSYFAPNDYWENS